MFDKYWKEIEKLSSFDKENILTKRFKLYSKNKLEIYYAPHNEVVNENAKIFIVGITPGWTQTSIAYQTAQEGLIKKLDFETIKKECKKNSRFAGSMRKNIIDMLNELKINEFLKINSCSTLFEENDILLHTTSVIPYPVFINGKNYTGSNPKMLESDILCYYIENYFYKEAQLLPNAFYIPLGKAVEEILEKMIEKNILKREQCLLGFPHPSGANGHRKKQFEQNKEELLNKVYNFFS